MESAIFSVSVDSNNGFDLIWRILELAVPGFKSMNPVQVPTWTPQTDVLSFCREHLLYFRLQSKHNMFFSARTQTNIFLRNIQLSEYADVVTTLQSQVTHISRMKMTDTSWPIRASMALLQRST